MQKRRLGTSGIEVGAVGLGTEHLYAAPQEEVSAVARRALDLGVTYVDMVFGITEYRERWATALRGRRQEAVLTCHLGSVEKDGQYMKSRNAAVCQASFEDYLRQFETDYVDVLMIHNLNRPDEVKTVMQPQGIVELAHRLRQEGKARAIGISGHDPATFLPVVNDGLVDVVMFPVNMSGNAAPGRRELMQACARRGVGVVAMKVFGGGRLLGGSRTHYFPSYQTGGKSYKRKVPKAVTPVQCISYALAQTAVSTALAGVRSVEEMEAAAAYLGATDEEKDFAGMVAGFEEYLAGECVYCNHCLPCPVHIDIGVVARLVDLVSPVVASGGAVPAHLQAEYDGLAARASACTHCGACVKRCPFGVDAVARIDRAAEVFEELQSAG